MEHVVKNRRIKEGWLEEKRLCAHALLNRAWVTKASDPEMFNAVRRHYPELRDWFQEYCGFALIITRQVARLEKVPGQAYPWMGFVEFTDPRDYGLFAFCLWYLEDKGDNEQFLLSEMVQDVLEHIASLIQHRTDLPAMDLTNYDHRLSLARALRKLRDLGVLITMEGDEIDWARQNRDVLYESSQLARFVLRHFDKELSSYANVAALATRVYPDTPEGQTRRRRHRVFRRLIQEPVVLDGEWSPEERAYALTQRHAMRMHLQEMLGLEGQRYREGLVFFHPDATGESELFPTAKAVSDLCLALAGELRRTLQTSALQSEYGARREPDGGVVLSLTAFEQMLAKLREQHGQYWSKEHRVQTIADLARDVLAHLGEWKLGGCPDRQTVTLSPALARWYGDYAATSCPEEEVSCTTAGK